MIEALIQGFDSGLLCELLNAKFSGAFSALSKSIPIEDDLPWERAEQLGVVKTLPGPNELNMPLLVVAVELSEGEELRERSSRIRQFLFAKKVLDDTMSNPSPGVEGIISQGLFVFHDDSGNFRLSLVYGKPEGTKLVWSAVRRQSFYVEAEAGNKTFRDRAALQWSPFDKLKDVFSVEKLTKEFYGRLFKWYQWALSEETGVTYPNDTERDDDDREIGEHIIRLITRLMFVWFLKQKHLVPDVLFDLGELKRILKKFDPGSGDNYYRAILQNLFFATLNSEIPERAFATEKGNRSEHFDIKTLYRYPKEFAISEAEVLELFKGIPFLNGGLFECLDRGRQYYDGFSRNRNKRAKVPNVLFFDEADGLIPLLNQYNFTVEENSPGDEEVALDPEMLGKVFENLLGAYNPETEVAARKATGSFYTPREIVNYMVDESLVAHLKGQCGDAQEDAIRKLVADGECPKDDQLCKNLDQALVKAKILDPACGSGAFPMGVLLRMVELLRILREIPEYESVYDLKLELIENCIYGADIQCIAVQISKLRFFISLVCEQKPTDDPKQNYGIHSLPNLETKFVAANSLIGLQKLGKDVLDLCTGDIAELKYKLFEIRHRHFSAKTFQEKKQLRREDKKLRDSIKRTVRHDARLDRKHLELLLKEREKVAEPKWVSTKPVKKTGEMFSEFASKSATQTEFRADANEKQRKALDAEIAREHKKESIPSTVIDSIADMLASWDPYDQNTSAPFSDPEWMFNVKDGFDLVIGNPPYVQIQKLPERTKTELAAQEYATFSKTADLYCLFYEHGGSLLNTTGTLCYISSNKFFRSGYAKPLRRLLTADYSLHRLIDFGELPIFEAGTDPVIMQFGKMRKSTFMAATIKNFEDVQILPLAISTLGRQMTPGELPEDGWSLNSKESAAILDKMRNTGTPLGEYVSGAIYRGVLTGFNNAFILSDAERDILIAADPKSAEIIKPLAKGDDVRQWHIRNKGRWIILTKIGVDIKRYPAIFKHLKQWEPELKKRQDQGNHWWELRACSYYDIFEQPKILYPEIARESRFTLDRSSVYPIKTIFSIPSSDAFLLGILNSKLVWHFLKNTCSSLGDPEKGGRLLMQAIYLETVPIPTAKQGQQTAIASRVDDILASKKTSPAADVSALESEIDQLVSKLYDLTPEEIAIVEESAVGSAKATGRSKTPKAKKKPARKRKTKLPPSLPGWD